MDRRRTDSVLETHALQYIHIDQTDFNMELSKLCVSLGNRINIYIFFAKPYVIEIRS